MLDVFRGNQVLTWYCQVSDVFAINIGPNIDVMSLHYWHKIYFVIVCYWGHHWILFTGICFRPFDLSPKVKLVYFFPPSNGFFLFCYITYKSLMICWIFLFYFLKYTLNYMSYELCFPVFFSFFFFLISIGLNNFYHPFFSSVGLKI